MNEVCSGGQLIAIGEGTCRMLINCNQPREREIRSRFTGQQNKWKHAKNNKINSNDEADKDFDNGTDNANYNVYLSDCVSLEGRKTTPVWSYTS